MAVLMFCHSRKLFPTLKALAASNQGQLWYGAAVTWHQAAGAEPRATELGHASVGAHELHLISGLQSRSLPVFSIALYWSQLCLTKLTSWLDLWSTSFLQVDCCWACSAPFGAVGPFPVLKRVLPWACLVVVLSSHPLAGQPTHDALGDDLGRKKPVWGYTFFHLCNFECFLWFVIRYWEMERAIHLFSWLHFEVLFQYGMTFLFASSVILFKKSMLVVDFVSLIVLIFFPSFPKEKDWDIFWTSLVEQTVFCAPADSPTICQAISCSHLSTSALCSPGGDSGVCFSILLGQKMFLPWSSVGW